MQIVYHLGAHCTDDERLIRCLLKNRAALAAENIAIPAPTRYRKLLRDTAVQLKGQSAAPETQAMVLEQILDGDAPERLVLSWDSFLAFPQWALRGALYNFAGERIRAFTQIFPEAGAEFHLAIRNPATFLPALLERQTDISYDSFVEGADLLALRWSDVVRDIREANPDVALTLWCDEDTPLIWPEVLQAVSGHSEALPLEDTDELLSLLMPTDALLRLRNYLQNHPPANMFQRRRITSAFLEKFAMAERLSYEIALPGWDADFVERLTRQYHQDIEVLRAMPGLRFIAP